MQVSSGKTTSCLATRDSVLATTLCLVRSVLSGSHLCCNVVRAERQFRVHCCENSDAGKAFCQVCGLCKIKMLTASVNGTRDVDLKLVFGHILDKL